MKGNREAKLDSFGSISVDVGFDPFDIGHDEYEFNSTIRLNGQGDVYAQDFDAAFRPTIGSTHLPRGWYADVGGKSSSIITDAFPTNEVLPGPYNVGHRGDSDRAFAIGDTGDSNRSEVLFEAQVVADDVRATRLSFDVEAWAADPLLATSPSHLALQVDLEFIDENGAFARLDLGWATTTPPLALPDHEQGEGVFGHPRQLISSNKSFVQTDDFNNDGYPDILAKGIRFVGGENRYAGLIGVALNNGDGTFAVLQETETPASARSIVAGDLDNDGNLDLVTTHTRDDQSNFILVLKGDGNGGLSEATSYETGSSRVRAGDATLTDMNNDGVLDVVIANFHENNSSITVFVGVGDGTLTALDPGNLALSFNAVRAAGRTFYTVARELADINGDGSPDLILSDNTGILIMANRGDGTFLSPDSYTASVSSYTKAITVGDFDDDGDLDVMLGGSVLFTNQGNAFSDSHVAIDAYRVEQIQTADLNNDGHLDIVSSRTSSCAVYVTMNKGDGSFDATDTYSRSGCNITDFEIDDVDGDQYLDVVAKPSSDADTMILNNDGDGEFSTSVFSIPGSRNSQLELANVDGDNDIDMVLGGTTYVVPNLRFSVDGNDDRYRMSFDSGAVKASIPADSRIRIRFSVPEESRSANWIFGLDNVEFRTLSPGDSNGDGLFNSSDFVAVFAAKKYESGEPAQWSDGDWNDDGLFDSADFVAALKTGRYEKPLPSIGKESPHDPKPMPDNHAEYLSRQSSRCFICRSL